MPGVSTGTVDRVLHNRGNVSPSVKKRVLKVIDELGYERNLLASALAYNRTIRVAVILPNPETDAYWGQIYNGVQKAYKSVQHYGLLGGVSFIFDQFDPMSFVHVAKKVLEGTP